MIQTLVLLLSLNAVAAEAPAAKPAAAPAQAAEPAPRPEMAAPKGTPEEIDGAAEQKVKAFEDCVDTLVYFREDLKAKKESLDKEFKGKVPSSFSNLLNLKANRIAKQHAACQGQTNLGIDEAMASLKTMDGNSPAFAARRKKLMALRERLNKALKLFAEAN
jgi:nucleoid-associated protein YgaU